MLAGTYNGAVAGSAFLSGLTGTATNPFAIVGEGAGTTIIDYVAGTGGLSFENCKFFVLQDFSILNQGGHGFNFYNLNQNDPPAGPLVVRNVQIRNGYENMHLLSIVKCFIFRSGTQFGTAEGMKIAGANNVYIDRCLVTQWRNEPIDLVGCSQVVITGCTLNDSGGIGIQSKGGGADVLIHGNKIERCGTGVNLGQSTGKGLFRPPGSLFEGVRVKVHNNVIISCDTALVGSIFVLCVVLVFLFFETIFWQKAFIGCDSCEAIGNTIIQTTLRFLIRFLPGECDPASCTSSISRNCIIQNNIFSFVGAALRSWGNADANQTHVGNVIDSNSFFSTDGQKIFTGTFDTANFGPMPVATNTRSQVCGICSLLFLFIIFHDLRLPGEPFVCQFPFGSARATRLADHWTWRCSFGRPKS